MERTHRLLILLVLLNMVDALATVHWVSMGATEANPIMAFYLAHSVFAFYAVKTWLIFPPVMMLWSQSHRPVVKRVTPALVAVYCVALAIHWKGAAMTLLG